MIILFLDAIYPEWNWRSSQTIQYAQLEVLFVDLPMMIWGAYMFITWMGV